MNTRRYLTVFLTLLIFSGLLSSITVITRAGDLILNNCYGYHTFDFNITKPGDTLFSEGYIAIENPTDSNAHISLLLFGGLKKVDVDSMGNPRTHTVSEEVVFYPIPDISWIRLNEVEFTINPRSEYRIGYTVEMPAISAYDAINENVSRGFLAYINVRGEALAGTGGIIGINYDFKVFVTFTGEYEEEATSSFPPWSVGIIVSVIAVASILFILKKTDIMKMEKLK